ncbi:MAG: hypothetical protein DMG72_02485 [Acidobacteria bacterium]|nr:MAG: hypothetical protein DMG72_02485 [Acidobacteriota bacterium]
MSNASFELKPPPPCGVSPGLFKKWGMPLLLAGTATLVVWSGLLRSLFSANFLPHGTCYLWNRPLVWLHLTSDVLIWLSYIAISCTLVFLERRMRKDIPFQWVYLAFGAFIVACGFTHLMEVIVLWKPVYWLSGSVKVVTAIASVGTAIALPSLVPKTIAMIQTAQVSDERERSLEIAYQQLELRNSEVERAAQLKSRFLASMSHELRTPLTAIIGFSDLLAEGTVGQLNDKQRRFAGHIRENGRHLLQLINDILDISKIEAGRLELNLQNCNVEEVLQETLTAIDQLAENKQIHVECVALSAQWVHADRVRLKQMLYNLLSNAVKFTSSGGKVTVESEFEDEFVKISVTDTGAGIREQDLGLIFEEFRQAGGTGGVGRDGTGLGLAITRRLVQQHGGKIWVTSEVDIGSRFSFTLPAGRVVSGVRDAVLRAAPVNQGVTSNSERPLILVVDDQIAVCELIKNYLEPEGYAIETAHSSTEALEKARRLRPAAITLDMLMPGTGGFETLCRLKDSRETANIPVVVVSVVRQESMGFTLGATEYVAKPVERAALLEVLRKHVSPRSDSAWNVLVVDDDLETRNFVSETLQSAGYRARAVTNGREALELLSGHQVDSLILDLVMPEMDGFEVLRNIRRSASLRDTPVFVLTGKDLSETEVAVLTEETRAWLRKSGPWKDDLLTQLRRAVAT